MQNTCDLVALPENGEELMLLWALCTVQMTCVYPCARVLGKSDLGSWSFLICLPPAAHWYFPKSTPLSSTFAFVALGDLGLDSAFPTQVKLQ